MSKAHIIDTEKLKTYEALPTLDEQRHESSDAMRAAMARIRVVHLKSLWILARWISKVLISDMVRVS